MHEARLAVIPLVFCLGHCGIDGCNHGCWLFFRGAPNREGPDYVILIVIDTLRADVVDEVYTPVLDGLIGNGSEYHEHEFWDLDGPECHLLFSECRFVHMGGIFRSQAR